MNKTHKVVMLPTQKSKNVGDIVMRPSDRRLATINVLTVDDPQEAINQHIYAISDDKIKKGDWAIHPSKGVYQAIRDLDELSGSKKIVASTDANLFMYLEKFPGRYPLPLIHESFVKVFINAHNNGKPITEVDLEMEELPSFGNIPTSYIIKTRPDNTVIIRESKTYSIDDMEKAFLAGKDLEGYDWHMNEFHGASCECKPLKYTNFDEWIQDNL